ncbi:MAG: hypothetical protein AMJ73_07605 [candidate division Zixibacteria bacterium SM1_73]|nr:MAG: hypothetical protein AMJ73_07605 [candidate division Zixibacteria bacterium SM1_73]
MRTYLECVPCIIEQTIKTARDLTQDWEKKEILVQKVLETLSNISYNQSPPYLGREAHRVIRKILDNPDPYLKMKKEFNRVGKELFPSLQKRANHSKDRFADAVKLAIAGNIIDFGPQHHFELMRTIDKVLLAKAAIDHTGSLRDDIESASTILYLGDNAGETFFDKILIEKMPPKEIYYGVRGSPVINDATSEDAYWAELDKVTKIISNGSDAPGTILEDCSGEFKDIFARSDLVIAKGHGNYETLNEIKGKKFYFLLMVKCETIAKDVGCSVGDFVVKKIQNAVQP